MSYGSKQTSRSIFYKPFCAYLHNSKTKGHVRTFYLLKDCSTVGDIYFLGHSCIQDSMVELWIQVCITASFRKNVSCILSLITWKLYRSYLGLLHIEWLLCYWKCIFSVLKLDARYNWWVMSPNTHGSLFPISHLSTYTCNLKNTRHTYGCSAYWTTALLSETFLVWSIRGPTGELWGPRHASVVLLCNMCQLKHRFECNIWFVPTRLRWSR